MGRLDGCHRWHVLLLTPGQKLRHGPAIGPARVWIADTGREELHVSVRGTIAGDGDQGRQDQIRVGGKDLAWLGDGELAGHCSARSAARNWRSVAAMFSSPCRSAHAAVAARRSCSGVVGAAGVSGPPRFWGWFRTLSYMVPSASDAPGRISD